jgi:hypothetical protein
MISSVLKSAVLRTPLQSRSFVTRTAPTMAGVAKQVSITSNHPQAFHSLYIINNFRKRRKKTIKEKVFFPLTPPEDDVPVHIVHQMTLLPRASTDPSLLVSLIY